MEQLVKALADETLNEVEFDETHTCENEEENNVKMWDQIAKVAIEEIETMFGDENIHPYGAKADEVVYTMKSLLEPYSVYPACHKLLSAIEQMASQNEKDPRAYVNVVLRVFDNDAAREWRNQRAFK